jgi:thioredoxin-like negative regulator of GroEL
VWTLQVFHFLFLKQRMIAPQFEELAKKYKGTDFYKVDVDQAPDIAQTCGVSAMPTFKFFKGGQVVGEVVGADINQIESLIQKHGASSMGEGRSLGGTEDGPKKVKKKETHVLESLGR